MRAINKGVEPVSLTAHRSVQPASVDNCPSETKDELRRALVAEQRGLCCYCMGRIGSDSTSMKIEHWRSQSKYPAEELNYRNLLAACLGGEGKPRHRQHCDTRKGDQDLSWNPAAPAHQIEARIRYEPDGGIRSDDRDFDAELDDVLNLNLKWLKNNRQGARQGIVEWWTAERTRLRGPVPLAKLERARDQYLSRTSNLGPFSQVAVWWLEQRIARMTA